MHGILKEFDAKLRNNFLSNETSNFLMTDVQMLFVNIKKDENASDALIFFGSGFVILGIKRD